MAADPSKLSYFSLPGEVRNKIMGYVLVGGQLNPYDPGLGTPTGSQDTAARVDFRLGVQLIATCKQAYIEGHGLFYSNNTFHLPPQTPFLWPERLQAKHRALIKRISITIGLRELTPSMLNRVESNTAGQGERYSSVDWASGVLDVLFETWEAKMRYIAAWESLEEIMVYSFGCTVVLRHHEVVAHLREPTFLRAETCFNDPYWRITFRRACLYVLGNIAAEVQSVGWKKTREWLQVRKPGQMAEGFMIRTSDLT